MWNTRSFFPVRTVLRYFYSNRTSSNLPSFPLEEYDNQKFISNVFSTNTNVSDVAPAYRGSFNVAAYVNKSDLLQSLLKIDVDLSRIEKKPYLMKKLLKCDESTLTGMVFFLSKYIDITDIGKILTKNPSILQEREDDLNTRINYLYSKNFSLTQIKAILAKNPFWLMFSTLRIDKRLGFFQEYFDLSGNEVRQLSAQYPKIITYNLQHVKVNTFSVKEEMGYSNDETKTLLLIKPKLFTICNRHLLERFNYLHNTIGISHDMILKTPFILGCRKFRMQQRHEFLEKLGRAQYDPNKENYVPIMALAEGTDTEFCKDYAKSNVLDFNLFLKTRC